MKRIAYLTLMILGLVAATLGLFPKVGMAGSLTPGDVVFYASQTEKPDPKPVYTTVFNQADVKYIFADYTVTPSNDMSSKTSVFKAVWLDPSGNVLGQTDTNVEWNNYRDGIVWTNSFSADKWAVGEYKVQFYIDGTLFTTKSFKVVRSFNTLNATLDNILFYESDNVDVPVAQRKYASSFDSSKIRYINWELNLKHLAPDERVDFVIHADYIDSTGKTIASADTQTWVEAGWNGSCLTDGWGSSIPGSSWKPGVYKLVLSIEGHQIGTGAFTITKPTPAKTPTKVPVKVKKVIKKHK